MNPDDFLDGDPSTLQDNPEREAPCLRGDACPIVNRAHFLRHHYRPITQMGGRLFYVPLYPRLFDEAKGWSDSWFDEQFRRAVLAPAGRSDLSMSNLCIEVTPDVWAFPLLQPTFCTEINSGPTCSHAKRLCEELINFERSGLPVVRPNSMNNYGVVLADMGLGHLMTGLQHRLQPLLAHLYPREAATLDANHSFLVRYRLGQDKGLDMHTDDSDVTVNVCLGRQFTGGELVFCGRLDRPSYRKHSATWQHRVGTAIVHLGRHRHGASDITSGERANLIIWNVSRAWRESPEFEALWQRPRYQPPDLVCLSRAHDADYELYITGNKEKKTEKEKGKGKTEEEEQGNGQDGKEREEIAKKQEKRNVPHHQAEASGEEDQDGGGLEASRAKKRRSADRDQEVP